VDELSSALGVVKSFVSDEKIREIVEKVQHHLLTAGAEIAAPPEVLPKLKQRIIDEDVAWLEKICDSISEKMEPIREFILPGKTKESALMDLARSVARRAERSVLKLYMKDLVSDSLYKYFNRLSSLLYALARLIDQGKAL